MLLVYLQRCEGSNKIISNSNKHEEGQVSMARLPKPGEDSGVWGEILNDYLLASHNNDGTLKANSVTSSTLADNSVNASSLQASAGTNGQVLTYDSQLSGGLGWKDTAAPNATSSTKGVISLSGDLGGTADSPSVPALTNKLDKDAAGVAGGVATLDATGKIPISQLPVLETQDTIKKAQAALLPFRLALGNRRNSRSVIFVQGSIAPKFHTRL